MNDYTNGTVDPTPVNTVTIPLEEYIRLRQAEQNNMYLNDRFNCIEDRLRDAMDELTRLANRVREVETDVKKLKA